MFGRHCPFWHTSCVFHNARHINALCYFIFFAPRDPDSTQSNMDLKGRGRKNVWHQQLVFIIYCVWTWTILIGYGVVAKATLPYHKEQSPAFAELLDFDSPVERQKFGFMEGFRVFYVWECESIDILSADCGGAPNLWRLEILSEFQKKSSCRKQSFRPWPPWTILNGTKLCQSNIGILNSRHQLDSEDRTFMRSWGRLNPG